MGPCQIFGGCWLPQCPFIQPPGCHVPHTSGDLCNGRGWTPFSKSRPDPCPYTYPCHGDPGLWNHCRWNDKICIFFLSMSLTWILPVVSYSPPLFSCPLILALMAFVFELSDLVDLTSIGTLLSYSMVAFSVLVLRYQPDQKLSKNEATEVGTFEMNSLPKPLESVPQAAESLHCSINTISSLKSGRIVYGCASLLVILLMVLCLILAKRLRHLFSGDPVYTTVAVLLLVFITGITFIIWRQPQDSTALHFKVPALPFLPLVSISVNVYLMMQLNSGTWVRFGIWIVIGFAIYFGYGIRHSLKKSDQQLTTSSSQTVNENIPSAELA
ncbi:cationic amino acid transporter 3-like [Loxodonta africana]|uniref:cationic amino acid transporter 3-like n=1 Tax=Loxodonta africana TaxID=9785 RepID=UPI0030CFF390